MAARLSGFAVSLVASKAFVFVVLVGELRWAWQD